MLAAEQAGAHYGLRLPGLEIAPGRGDAHRAACLQALALHADRPHERPPHPLAPETRAVTLRDLAWLLLALLLVIAPHTLRAPWWLTLLTLCLYGWRVQFALTPRAAALALAGARVAALSLLGVWTRVPHAVRPQPGIVLLVLFSGLKLLETRTHRDGAVRRLPRLLPDRHQLPLHADDPHRGADVRGAARDHRHAGRLRAPQRAPRANLRTAGLLLAHAAPAALALFLLFPRVQGPLWGLPQDAYAGMTGLSDTMSPGNLSQLALSDAIAFRAEFQGDTPRAAPALLARAGAVGLRRPHLEHGAELDRAASSAPHGGSALTATW